MTSLLIGCGNLGEIILKGFNKSNKKILVLEQKVEISKHIRIYKDSNHGHDAQQPKEWSSK